MSIPASENMQKYFDRLQHDVNIAFDIASNARKKGFDPVDFVEVKLAKNLAERVVGLISVIAPQIVGTNIVQRIQELEKTYGNQDWRVAMVIAHEVALQKFCKFENELEAIEIGIRIGFAYVTVGVVSSPLEGFTHMELVDRKDGKGKYFCMHFAGPIRNAGGTAAATSVVIADYVRKQMGFLPYDPDDNEVQRTHVELMDYHERVTNLQYVPSKQEAEFMTTHCPIQINGDASEKFDVSSFKDLPRVHTNKIRSGFCLIHSSCIPLKAPKLWKKISKWYQDMNMEDWTFLEEFLTIQKKAKAKGGQTKKTDAKISPVYTYIADLVGGRPVIGHPLRSGAMRLRYGRGRVSGFSAQSLHPATMGVLDDFIAVGTQLKVERPGKAAAMTTCDTIDGPIVLLENGDVVKPQNYTDAKKLRYKVKEILYLGDVLINYGDFFDRAHTLVPSGYCEEWWAQELKKIDTNKEFTEWTKDPLHHKPTYAQAKHISETTNIPLHPKYIFFYNEVPYQDLTNIKQLANPLPYDEKIHTTLCHLGIPLAVREETIVLSQEVRDILKDTLQHIPANSEGTNTETISQTSPFVIKDKSGTFIGARMGRPEKGKQRKLSTSPHGLFPVAEQGGRLRSFQSCVENGFIRADCATYLDNHTKKLTPLTISHHNEQLNKKVQVDNTGKVVEEGNAHTTFTFTFKDMFDYCAKKFGGQIPDLIKGVQGTVSQDHDVEHPLKAYARAQHNVFVNKDGTIRYDASEIPITHFKPKEIRTSVTKLRELGYTHDIHGKQLEHENQVCEIIPQDILLPCCPASPNQPADEVLYNITKFVDQLLVKVYGVEPYYKLQSPNDLAGHYVVGLAPHTSAGTVGRIIGFTQSQGMYCHPLFHAANRRDCDGDELCYMLLMDAFLNFSTKYLPSSRGGTMDAPLVLTSLLDPTEVDDMAFNMDVCWEYPLELYQAAESYKKPWDIKMHLLEDDLKTPQQLEGMGFTHDTNDFNEGALCSAYKILPSMREKVEGQMALADKIRAVDQDDVARIVVQTHFIRDTRGNLRKYSMQEFRCVTCNTKYRRPPLGGQCTNCQGKIVFTISQGSIVKYLEPSLSLAERYKLPRFLHQSLELTQDHIEGIFGRDKERQTGLGQWF